MVHSLVSIVVPVYNAAEFMLEGIRSLQEQTYRKLEIILIDDGSNDDSSLICDNFAAEDTRIHVLHQTNQGVSAARNAGVRIATGDYIMFFDPDDKLLRKDCIEKAVEESASHDADVVVFQYCNINEDNVVTSTTSEEPHFPEGVLSPVEACRQLFLFGCENYIWRLLIRHHLFVHHDLEFPPYATYEDLDWIHRVFLYSNLVVFLPEVMYGYRHSSRQQTAEYTLDKLLDMYHAVNDRHRDITHMNPKLIPYSKAYVYAQYINIYRKLLSLQANGNVKELKRILYSKFSIMDAIRMPYLKNTARIQIILLKVGLLPVLNSYLRISR